MIFASTINRVIFATLLTKINDKMNLFLITFAALFSVLNPIGNLPVFLGLTHGDTSATKNRIALWVAINVFVILIISFFIGEYILSFFGITIPVLKVTGGFLICLAGFSLLSKSVPKNDEEEEIEKSNSNIAMTPLALPLIAGPGSMSLLIAKSNEHPELTDKAIIIAAVFAVSLIIYIFFRSGNLIPKLLGVAGMTTVSKIIGFLVLAIGLQYITDSLLIIFKI